MGKKNTKKSKFISFLIVVIFILITIIIIGTIVAILRKNDTKATLLENTEKNIYTGAELFTDLGRIRAVTGDKPPSSVVIFPVLEYSSKDTQFREELVQKKEKLRDMILDWFLHQKAIELYTKDELTIKNQLLNVVNSVLTLSSVKRLYFKEFIILGNP